MPGKQVGYIRVSSVEQNTARQLADVKLDRIYEDRCSGKDAHRPQLEACLAYVRDDDVLHVHSLDRLARNVEDLLSIVRRLTSAGVTVVFHSEGLTFTPDGSEDKKAAVSKLLLTMLGAIAEFERSLIRKRQREGIEHAKRRGVYKGRPSSLSKGDVEEIMRLKSEGVTIASIARCFRRSRQCIYTAVHAAEEDAKPQEVLGAEKKTA